MTPRKLIVVAGAGAYPRLIVEGAKAAGVETVDVLAVRGSTDRATMRAGDHVHVEGVGRTLSGVKWVAENGYDGAILA